MEKAINLREYMRIIKKKSILVLLITLTAMLISGLVSFFLIKPVYRANTTLIINRSEAARSNVMTGDDYSVTQKLAVTYGAIIKSRSVLGRVIEILNLDMSYEELSSMISVDPVDDTQIINIEVQDINPERAMNIANAIPTVFQEEVIRITEANEVKVIDQAILPTTQTNPSKVVYIAIGTAVGFIAALFIVFLLECIDRKIKRPEDIQKYLNIPVLGVIPKELGKGAIKW